MSNSHKRQLKKLQACQVCGEAPLVEKQKTGGLWSLVHMCHFLGVELRMRKKKAANLVKAWRKQWTVEPLKSAVETGVLKLDASNRTGHR